MTFKIQRSVVGEDRVLLRVSGQISGDQVSTFGTLLDQEKSTALTLDLKDLLLLDGAAVKLLAIHEANGAQIIDCPMYIREWIRRERAVN